MASYSVSDAVATYYLYMKYVHNFVLSLCTIIPLTADDVLRKGSGTLCEMLLQVEAHANDVIAPNKQVTKRETTFEGHLLETETYIGGHVESLESGVFRSDLPEDWRLDASAFDELIGNLDRALKFALEVEEGVDISDVTNYREVRRGIVRDLEKLRDRPVRREKPTIYHLDVAAMYPNIILSNRLQPSAVVSPETCAACEFNSPDNANQCKRTMDWTWRGEYFPASRAETEMIRMQLETETFTAPPDRWGRGGGGAGRFGGRFGGGAAAASAVGKQVPYSELPPDEREAQLQARLKLYCQRQYKRVKDTRVEPRKATICQREHPFYIDTVRAFRDRRYEYKGLTKQWSKTLSKAEKSGNKLAAEAARTRVVLYDSLQLAHKCILNSFYGYVMRKGSRWFSMEMGGVVTQTGANLIKQARELVERIGRPLELDTDGIWCMLPCSFPEDVRFQLKTGRTVTVSYPCVMLNVDVHDRYTNHQYQTLVDPAARRYATHSECSIYFEVDGPYRCMVLPASQEEGKLLKKRYAVFNPDGSLAELKGFELKRRGELKIIKIFQSQVFSRFLEGASLEDCYAHVAAVADYWLDVLDSQGEDLEDEELMALIGEARNMSKTLEEYGNQKSTAISTAKRLAEFLGAEMVKDKGLNCNLLIARKPEGAPVTERAIPRDIFNAEPGVKKHFLRKWCKDPGMTDFDVRSIVDWGYYRQRLANAIQKIVTIPAALQRVANPVPRIAHPDWLLRVVRQKADPRKQRKLGQYFSAGGAASASAAAAPALPDIEDVLGRGGGTGASALGLHVARVRGIGSRRADAAAAGGSLPASSSSADGGAGEEKEAEAEESDGPAMEDDVVGWLDRRSRLFKKRKRAREAEAEARGAGAETKRGAMAVAAAPRLRAGLAGGLAGYVDDVAGALASGYLQVLEVRDTGSAGEMVVWAMPSARSVQRLRLTVPRRLLINCVRAVPSLESRRRTMTLPHGRRAMHLYEICRSEATFRSRGSDLRLSQGDSLVEGVYESRTPLLMRALMDIGCVVSIKSEEDDERRRELLQGRRPAAAAAARRRRRHRQSRIGGPGASAGRSASRSRTGPSAGGDEGEDLLMLRPGGDDGRTFLPDHFDFLPAATHPYLEPASASLRRAFVFHLASEGRDGVRGVTLLAFVSETTAHEAQRHVAAGGAGGADGAIGGVTVPLDLEAYVITVVPPTRGGAPPLPQTRQIFVEENAKRRGHRGNALRAKTTSVASMRDMWGAASRAVSDFVRRNPGPLVVSAASSVPKAALVGLLAPLGNLPVVFRGLTPAEAAPLPALAWHNAAATRAVVALVSWFQQWPETLALARYCQTPVGNLDVGAWASAADLFFARLLRTNHHAVWMSETRLPDLGGAELRSETDALLELRPVPTFDWASGFRSAQASHAQAKAAAGSRGGGGRAFDGHVADAAGADGGASQRDPRASPSVNRPGAYRRACVQLDISHLALNTVLHASHLDDMAGVQHEAAGAEDDDDDAAGGADADLAAGLVDHAGPASGPRCRAAFRWLQALVASWHRDLVETQNPFADQLLVNLYSWLSSPSSRLHDPALHRAVRALMVKVWQLLVTEVRRLGAVVVYADFSRLVLATPKHTPAAACAWTSYLLSTVASRPVFATLAFSPSWFSAGLLWLGPADFASLEVTHPAVLVPEGKAAALVAGSTDPALLRGADGRLDGSLELLHTMGLFDPTGRLRVPRAAEPEEGEESDEEEEEDDEDEERGRLPARGKGRRPAVINLSDDEAEDDDEAGGRAAASSSGTAAGSADDTTTPPRDQPPATGVPRLVDAVQYAAQWNLASFLPPDAARRFGELVQMFLERPFRKLHGKEAAAAASSATAAVATSSAAREARVSESARRCVASFLSPRLHSAAQELVRAGGDEKVFPDRPGKHLSPRSPALEMAKSVCFVLALDAAAAEEAGRLRKSVLRMLDVADFSPEAVWRDPCLSYVLPDVVCDKCRNTRDLDICRDPYVRPSTEEEARAGKVGGTWFCPECETDYDVDEVETALVTTLQQRSAAFQLQDLYCTKTRDVRSGRLSEVSEVSARWVNAEPSERFRERLRVFAHIARQHAMEWLADEAAFLLGEA